VHPRASLAAALASFVALAGCGGGGTTASKYPEVRIEVTDRGFEPDRASVPRGQPVTLVITRRTDQTCAKDVVIPALNVTKDLPLNRPVQIDVPGGIADSLSYQCGMDMLGGVIVAK
jgi:plastocyanin domain-containing protein